MKLILILLLTFFLLPSERSIQVVFIEPQDETFTAQEQRKALRDLNAALNYWNEHAPLPTPIHIRESLFITTTEDILNETNRPIHVEDMAVFIIDNSNSSKYIHQYYAGIANDTAMWTVTSVQAETYAHELGHMLYGLGHHYEDAHDIMGLTPELAWANNAVGCGTLADLQRPCIYLYLPLVGAP